MKTGTDNGRPGARRKPGGPFAAGGHPVRSPSCQGLRIDHDRAGVGPGLRPVALASRGGHVTGEKTGSGRRTGTCHEHGCGPRRCRGPQPFSLLGSDGRDHGLETVPSLSMLSAVFSKHFAEMLCCAVLLLSKLTSHDTLAAVVETVVLVVCTVVPEAGPLT